LLTVLLATRPQVNRTVTVNPRLANRAVNRAFLQPALWGETWGGAWNCIGRNNF